MFDVMLEEEAGISAEMTVLSSKVTTNFPPGQVLEFF
jgi:hypothetical protein